MCAIGRRDLAIGLKFGFAKAAFWMELESTALGKSVV